MEKEVFMREALKEAQKAYDKDEVPIGAIVVYKNKIIGRGHNRRVERKSTLSHGEIEAIAEACDYMNDWRLEGASMYVTIEPCLMCSGAILQGRMDKIYFGAPNKKFGTCGSIIDVFQIDDFNHKVNVEGGILERECRELITDYFKKYRR